MKVYNPRYTNNKVGSEKQEYNEKIVFQKKKDCEQWILQKGFLRKLNINGQYVYISENRYKLIVDREEEIIEEQKRYGLNFNELDWDFAINNSIYNTSSYIIEIFDFVETQVYQDDIEREEERIRKQQEFQDNLDNVKRTAKDTTDTLVNSWNNSEAKKSASKFFGGLGQKARQTFNDLTQEEKVEYNPRPNTFNSEYFTTEEVINELEKYFNTNETAEEIYINKFNEPIAVVSKINMYSMRMESGFNNLADNQKETLHKILNKYSSTPIEYRKMKRVEKYTLDSDFLNQETKNTEFETEQMAENYKEKVINSIIIKKNEVQS